MYYIKSVQDNYAWYFGKNDEWEMNVNKDSFLFDNQKDANKELKKILEAQKYIVVNKSYVYFIIHESQI